MPKILILISGKAGSGKDTLSEYLSNSFHGRSMTVQIDKIAQTMKDRANTDFNKLSEFLNKIADELWGAVNVFGDIQRDPSADRYYKSLDSVIDKLRISDENWYEKKTDLTRILLQIYGTKIFQDRVSINYWDEITKKRILESNKDVVIITDVRFQSNIDNLSDGQYKTYCIRINRANIKENDHITEKALDNYQYFDYIVENNSSLDDLKKSASRIIHDILE